MIEKIKQDELIFFQTMRHPKACAEILFHDFDAFGSFSENEYGEIRNYQIPFLSFDGLFCENPNLKKEINFELKKGMGENYALGGRLTGKTCVHLITDCLISTFLKLFNWSIISSSDLNHIRGVMDKITNSLRNHKILKHLNAQIKQSPAYVIHLDNGCLIESVNNNLSGKDPGCVDDKTEILTNVGWKYFKDLNKKDKCLTLNNEGVAFFKKPRKIIKEFYDGKLLKFVSKNSEFLFTQNHNLFVLENGIRKFKRADAKNHYKQIYMPSFFEWKGKKSKYIKFFGISNFKIKSFKVKTELWCKFVAWYLSEGWLVKTKDSHYRIAIAQKKNCSLIEDLLKNMNLKYSKYMNNTGCFIYIINNKLIYKHLKKYFGFTKTKHISKYFKNLDAIYLKIFIDEYVLGNGNINIRDIGIHRVIFTSLKILSDDLQEVAQKAGYKTNLIKSYCDKRFGNDLMYVITLCISKNSVFKRDLITEVDYRGYVYCVDIFPYHTMLIRRNGHVVWTGNSHWYGKHCDRNYEEETSFVTEEVSNKKKLGVAELGCIFRLSGMTTFSKLSPMGRIYYDYNNRKKLINIPSYVNPTYTQKKDNELIQEFGGKQSHGYQVQVLGKVMESGDSVFLIDEIRKTYKNDKKDNPILVKNFEINKDNISKYKDKIIIEKPNGIERSMIALDKGEGAAPTEIIVLFKLGKKWHYEYNITLFRLKPDEDETIIEFIIDKIQPNVIAIDSTSDKTLLSNLAKKYGENVYGINFNECIEVGFKKNGDKVEHDENGKPVMLKEDMVHFSMQCLKDIFYKGQIECLTDYKLDQQFDGVISSTTSKGKILYGYKTENHLFQAFQVFAIANWLTEKKQLEPAHNRKPGMGVFG